MTITKPNTQSIVVGVAILVAFISSFLSWATLGPFSADLFDFGGKGTLFFILTLVALALWVATLFIQAFPPNVQMPLMGAPIFLAGLGIVTLLFGVLCFFDSAFGTQKVMGTTIEGADRGFGLWLGLLAVIVWTVVSAIQAKPLLEAAKAMKAAQTPPPAGPNDVPPAV